MSRIFPCARLCGSMIASLAITVPLSPADAQAAPPTPAATGSDAPGDIVVTAYKREERLQNVGATIEALSSETLRTSRIAGINDLSSYAPNVDIKETVPGALPTVTIRGIGLDDFSTVSSPAAGVYVDEIPLASPGLMSGNLFDLQRIEVLKGPQGTLYGRNTTAGAINILSAPPGKTFGYAARISYGNYDTVDADVMINAPLGDRAQLRLSGKTVQQGTGYWTSSLLENGTPGRRDIGSRNIWLGRAELALQPTDELELLFKVEGERSRSEMGVPQFNGTFAAGMPFALCPAVLAGHLDNGNCTDAYGYRQTRSDPYKGDWKGSFPYNIDQVNLLAKIRYRVGGFELTSITGYIDFKRLYHIDVDATPLDQFDFIENEKIRQFTQELRIGRETKLVDIIAGGFYSWDRVTGNNSNVAEQWPLVLFGAASGAGTTAYDQVTRSAALYANATWHFGPRVDLVTGLRYTSEKRHYVGGTTFDTPSPLFGINDTFIDGTIRDHNLTGRIALNFRPREGLMLYASASRGRKSGGFFSGFTNNEAQLIPYRPETLNAFEVGAKTQFSRLVTFNIAGFWYDYHDPQTYVRYVDPATGLSVQKVGNVSHARVYGSDIDMILRPTERWTLTGGIGLLDTRLASFTTAAGTIPAGNRLPNAPTTSLTGRIRYDLPISDAMRISFQGETRYSSSVFKDAANDPLIAAGRYWLFNGRIALTHNAGWEVAIWGRNLSDRRYEVQGTDLATLGIVNKNYNAPRTFGVELSWRH